MSKKEESPKGSPGKKHENSHLTVLPPRPPSIYDINQGKECIFFDNKPRMVKSLTRTDIGKVFIMFDARSYANRIFVVEENDDLDTRQSNPLRLRFFIIGDRITTTTNIAIFQNNEIIELNICKDLVRLFRSIIPGSFDRQEMTNADNRHNMRRRRGENNITLSSWSLPLSPKIKLKGGSKKSRKTKKSTRRK
jgi:hypothetical protein